MGSTKCTNQIREDLFGTVSFPARDGGIPRRGPEKSGAKGSGSRAITRKSLIRRRGAGIRKNSDLKQRSMAAERHMATLTLTTLSGRNEAAIA